MLAIDWYNVNNRSLQDHGHVIVVSISCIFAAIFPSTTTLFSNETEINPFPVNEVANRVYQNTPYIPMHAQMFGTINHRPHCNACCTMKSSTLFSDYCDQSNCDMAVVAKPSEQCKTEFQFILLVLKVTLLTFKPIDKEELRTMKYSPTSFCFL